MKKVLKKNLEFFIVFGLILVFLIFYLWDSIVITIFPGHTGVQFRRLFNKGTVIEKNYEEGTHFILPWNEMYVYDVRIQELKQQVEVLSQNGLTIRVVVSVRYFLLKEEVPLLHQRVGQEYRDKVIIPSTISSVREVIGKYLPEQLYTTARHVIQDEILVGTIEETGRLPIIYSDMIIERIQLPNMINRAIETKLKHQQEYLEYQYKILKTEQEKKRQIIEATGIKRYQEIITKSLSDPLLKWQGIKATQDIAKSNNAKIIIIGGKDGLPIILNTGDSNRPAQPASPLVKQALDSAKKEPKKAGAQTKTKTDLTHLKQPSQDQPNSNHPPSDKKMDREKKDLPPALHTPQAKNETNSFLQTIKAMNDKLAQDAFEPKDKPKK